MNTKNKIQTRLVSMLLTLVVLGISFGCIYITSVLQVAYEESGQGFWLTSLAAFMAGILIVIINLALGQIIRFFASFERYTTYSHYTISVAIRLSIATFINTAVIVLLVHLDPDDWFITGGLAESVFYIMISNAFLQPLFYLFDPFYIIQLIRRSRAGKNEQLN